MSTWGSGDERRVCPICGSNDELRRTVTREFNGKLISDIYHCDDCKWNGSEDDVPTIGEYRNMKRTKLIDDILC